MAVDGLVTIASKHGANATADWLDAEIKKRGPTLFARIDHAAGASAVGLALHPTEVLIFGNARGGTPLMQGVQTIGIDLPLRALVWEDDAGGVSVSYFDPHTLAARHGLGQEAAAAVAAISTALAAIATAAAS